MSEVERAWPPVSSLFRSLPDHAEPSTMSGPADLVDTSPYAIERDLVARAVPARCDELFTGRTLARAALGALGVAPVAIGRRPDRSPDWPDGVLGSITHTRGLGWVVVVRPEPPPEVRPEPAPEPRTPSIVGVGLDAEVDARLDEAVVRRVVTPVERERLGLRTADDAVVVLSVKEAVFKAVNPASGVWLELDDVEVVVGRDDDLVAGESDGGWFTVGAWAADLPGLAPGDVSGRWSRFGAWVLAGAVATRSLDQPRP
ncbi:MAG: 4'-phosphopantetheinyl transferase family protein [Acidimicrobiales bacterium]